MSCPEAPQLQKEREQLLKFIIGKLCHEDGYLIEHVLNLYQKENSQDVLDALFRYIRFHYMGSPSVKKIKLLLEFLKQLVSSLSKDIPHSPKEEPDN